MGDTLKGFTHVGLLCNEPPSMTGLPFIQSSDELKGFSLSSGAWKAMPPQRSEDNASLLRKLAWPQPGQQSEPRGGAESWRSFSTGKMHQVALAEV